ncbi:MAG: ABC transporter permease [Candidatus Lernaella stagnicola]|nr:ABC transporter permease [Candidatus Lernaella stagnicola]
MTNRRPAIVDFWRRVWDSMTAEWRFLPRHPMTLLILVGLPFLYPPIISLLYVEDQATERPVVVVDQDNSELSRRFTTMLDATQGAEIIRRTGELDKELLALRRRQVDTVVYLPAGFSRQARTEGGAELPVWFGAANMYTYSLTVPAVYGVVGELNKQAATRFFMQRGMTGTLAERRADPINQDVRYLFHPTAGYGNFFVPGIFIIVMQQLVLISLAFSIGMQRELDLYDTQAARPIAYLLGKYNAHLAFYVTAMLVILFVMTPLFGWTVTGYTSIILLYVVFMLAMMPLALAVAHYCRDRYMAFQLLMFASTPLFMLSGFAWPYEQMPRYLQILSWLFPATPALQALRIVAMKSAAVSDIAPYLGVLALQFVGYWVLLVVLVRRFPILHNRPPLSGKSAP